MGYENINGMMVLGYLGIIFKKEGVKGLYCGFFFIMVVLFVNWVVYFIVYEQLKGMFQVWEVWKNGGVVGKGGVYVYLLKFLVGVNMLVLVGVGVIIILVINLLWVVKIRI